LKFLRLAAFAFVVLLLVGFALAFSVYQTYTSLANFNRDVKARFADWEEAQVPLRVMLSDLAEITAPYDPEAKELAEDARHILSDAPGGQNPESRIATHLLFGKTLYDLRSLAGRYPQLKSSDLFREWEAGYLKTQVGIETAKAGYNIAVRNYNSALDSFSGKIISLLFTVPPKPVIPG
jgi:hypothetical protein